MDKKKIEIIAAALLAAVFVVIFAVNIAGIGRKNKPSAYASKKETISLFDTKAPVSGKSFVDKDTPWGRDPFVLYETAKNNSGGVDGLGLMGITLGADKKPMAIINNEMVRAGSKIGKFTVIKISKGSVTVTDGENVSELKISK